ncbi:MAG: hypothetical protein JO307_13375 [Bryobacterales bacterium]|nr:hypothetical protein [Bryobacterales bacterium]
MLARSWSAALLGYTLAPAAALTQIVSELRGALDWLAVQGSAHDIAGPVIIPGGQRAGTSPRAMIGSSQSTGGTSDLGDF